jgi:hypothetical protein
METLLVRTMSDTVESDIQRVFTIANEILARYAMASLSFEQLRKIADGPFDLFLIPSRARDCAPARFRCQPAGFHSRH